MARLLYESHMHTTLCRHSIGEPEEYAQVAWNRNLAGITVTCHNPMPNGYSASVRMREDQWDEYVALVARATAAWAGRIDVRLGLEADFVPGFEKYLEKQIGSAKLSHVLGSVHPQVGEYIRAHLVANNNDAVKYQQTYFEHIAMAAETGLFDTISHPDIVKNHPKGAWVRERVWGDILRALDRIAKTGVAMELNTSGVNKVIPEMNPGPEMLAEMFRRGIPVVIGADAHEPGRVGDRYGEAMGLLEAAGYEKIRFFVDRVPRDVGIDAARASLAG